jgi:ribonuclease HI
LTISSKKGRAWIDGAARGNPGDAGFGVHLEIGPATQTLVGFLGQATNNVAEYAGLIAALGLAHRLGIENLTIFSDSQLLVRQMLGQYRVKAAHLKPLFLHASKLRRQISQVEILHVGREDNSLADGLANRAIDERSPLPEWLELGVSLAKS